MINEIMSKNIIYGNISNSIKDISKLMKSNNIGFIPIKDKDNFIGVVTDRDICLACTVIKSIDDCIKPFISKSLICVDIDDSIEDALNILSKYKIKRLLVKGKDNKIVGVLSLSDILMFYDNSNIVNSIKTIFFIHDNNSVESAEIDEFYL